MMMQRDYAASFPFPILVTNDDGAELAHVATWNDGDRLFGVIADCAAEPGWDDLPDDAPGDDDPETGPSERLPAPLRAARIETAMLHNARDARLVTAEVERLAAHVRASLPATPVAAVCAKPVALGGGPSWHARQTWAQSEARRRGLAHEGWCEVIRTQAELVQRDTGLTPHQQAQREQIVVLWLWRIEWIRTMSACDARTALQAIEDADQEANG